MRRLSIYWFLVCLTSSACDRQAPPSKEGDSKPPVDVRNVWDVRIWFRVKDDDRKAERVRKYLIRVGEKAFPAYEAILADRESYAIEVANVFALLTRLKGDRSRFRVYAVARLTDKDHSVRSAGVELLERIGSPSEASPVVALLSDKETYVARTAATTLAAIGGPNEVVAMDVWLRGVSHRDDRELREHVQKCRDELKKRLDAKKTPEK